MIASIIYRDEFLWPHVLKQVNCHIISGIISILSHSISPCRQHVIRMTLYNHNMIIIGCRVEDISALPEISNPLLLYPLGSGRCVNDSILFTAWWCYTGWVKRVILTFCRITSPFFVWHHSFWYYITLFSVLPHPFGIIFTLFPYCLILLVLFSHFSSYYFTFLLLFPHFHSVIVDSS